MKKLRLKRISENPYITFGVLLDDSTGLPICLTLENPYLQNEKNISSIPEGNYFCKPYSSEKYKDVYVVCNVPNREGILFHIGNTENHTKGCILPGMKYGYLNDDLAVLNSFEAMEEIRKIVQDDNFILVVE